ncbi:CvpA family protein [Ferruginibacter albus]|uniref:CvpA family protein n=1 Tax=Ferruginibacter albus TaxID=2875540 RepID=UPI001CC6B78A|nr:CvpA family protein [Ferruginibacter albus]UAY52319.1 CvpA family protein [Ferruginibacter albus]
MLIDVIYIILIIIVAVKGYRNGLVVAAFSFAAIFIGMAAAIKLSAVVANRLADGNKSYEKWLPFVSYILVFIGAVFLVRLIGRLTQKTAEAVMLGFANRMAGALIYIVLYTLVFSIFLFYIEKIHLLSSNTIQASKVYPYIKPIGPKAIDLIGDLIPIFKNLFKQLESFFEGVATQVSK